jgi:TPR repeat protein
MAGVHATAGDDQKSVVLRGWTPERNSFILNLQNSRDELWYLFMLGRDANGGDPGAQHELGIRYLTGKGFLPDTVKAAYWIRKAADQNVLTARYNYGILLNNGFGVEWNPFEAYKHFQYAAAKGLVDGQYVYGLLFTDNLIVSRNYAQAYKWIKMAADVKYAPAQDVLGEFKRLGIRTDSPLPKESPMDSPTKKDSKRASTNRSTKSAVRPVYLDFDTDSLALPDDKTLKQDVMREDINLLKASLPLSKTGKTEAGADSLDKNDILFAAESGNPEALTLIGLWCEEGRGVEQDLVQATVYYLRAIRFDSPRARQLLWRMTKSNHYFTLLKARVQANDPLAQFAWAGLKRYELDQQLLEPQALELLQHSAAQRFSQAIIELGMCYYSGFWVKANRDSAIALFKFAESLGTYEATIRIASMEILNEGQPSHDTTLMNTLWDGEKKGSVLAQQMLGLCYQNGINVTRDKGESAKYYRKAAHRGSTAAYNALRNLYDEIRPSDPEFQIQE